jgi:hypothetical protein
MWVVEVLLVRMMLMLMLATVQARRFHDIFE